MPEGHDATIEVCNIMSFLLYTQILKQSVLKPASPGITLNLENTMHFTSLVNSVYMAHIAAMTKPGKIHCVL